MVVLVALVKNNTFIARGKIIEPMVIMKFSLGLVVLLVSVGVLDEPPLPRLPEVTQQLDIGRILDVCLIHGTRWLKIQL